MKEVSIITISGMLAVLLVELSSGCMILETAPNHTTTLPFPPGNYANRASDAVLNNPNIEGVLLSARWRNIETSKGRYNWSKLDKKIDNIANAEKKVVLNIMTSGVNAPEWLIDDPEVETFEFVDINPHHPIYGQTFKIPVYWDEKYLNEKQKFINELGNRYVNNPAVVGVMVSFVGTINNDWYIPKDKYRKGDGLTEQELLDKGYSTDKMFETGKETIDMWANAFSKQALKLPIGTSIADGDNTMTTLAERILDYAYSTYPDRFYAQINGLCTVIPKANSPQVQDATPDSMFYLLKLLSQHPGDMGFQMISSVTKDPTRVDKAKICPASDSRCILEKTIESALTYDPHFIEYWYADVENPELQHILEILVSP